MIETFIRRPVFTTMFILLLVVFGIRCYPEIGVDLNPDVDMPIVSVRVTYDGASPEEMETLITKPIENRVSQVAGYKTISSTVLEGYSETVLEFNMGVDPQAMASEVREKVASVRNRLPDDIDEPVVQTVDLTSQSIVAYTFSSESRSRGEIRRLIEDSILDEMQMVEGVAEVTVIRLVAKPDKLMEYGISFQNLLQKVDDENYNTPGGKARNHDMEITVRTIGKYSNIDDIKKVVIANHNGKAVYIGDVADVIDGWEDEDTFASANGVPCVMTFVRKQSKTNTVDVTDRVNAKMEELKQRVIPPDIKVDIVRDQSTYVRENIADVWNTIFFGGALALFITYMFLGNFNNCNLLYDEGNGFYLKQHVADGTEPCGRHSDRRRDCCNRKHFPPYRNGENAVCGSQRSNSGNFPGNTGNVAVVNGSVCAGWQHGRNYRPVF